MSAMITELRDTILLGIMMGAAAVVGGWLGVWILVPMQSA